MIFTHLPSSSLIMSSVASTLLCLFRELFVPGIAFFSSLISICSFCSFRVSLLFIISHCYFIVIVTTAFMALSDNSDIGSFHLLLSVFSLENGLHFSGASY